MGIEPASAEKRVNLEGERAEAMGQEDRGLECQGPKVMGERGSCCLPSQHLVFDFKMRGFCPHVKCGKDLVLESGRYGNYIICIDCH